MKPFLRHISLLLVLAVGAMLVNDRINRALVLASSGSAAYKMYRLFIAPPPGEIPIFGSSRAELHYVPSLLSPKAFDYGISGADAGEFLFHVRQALRSPSSAPILINLDPWGFPPYSGRQTFRADYILALPHPAVRAALPPERRRLSERIFGIRFHGAFRKNFAGWLNERKAVTKKIDHGAVLELRSRTPKEWKVMNAGIRARSFTFDSRWQRDLDAIYASARRPIIWIVGPISPRWRELFTGEKELLQFLDEQRARPNVYAIDFYTSTADYTEAEFVDPTHLNIDGAKRFTVALLSRLRELRLPDFP